MVAASWWESPTRISSAGWTQSGTMHCDSVHCVASSTITMGSCVPWVRKEFTCTLAEVTSVVTIYAITRQRHAHHTRLHENVLLVLLAQITVALALHPRLLVLPERLDASVHHPVQLVALQVEPVRAVLPVRVAAHTAQAHHHRRGDRRQRQHQLLQQRVHGGVGGRRDHQTRVLRVTSLRRAYRVDREERLHEGDDGGGRARARRTLDQVHAGQPGTRERGHHVHLIGVELG